MVRLRGRRRPESESIGPVDQELSRSRGHGRRAGGATAARAVLSRPSLVGGLALLVISIAGVSGSSADTMEGALVLAYRNNPQLNAQRAATRAADETVGIALSGYRPTIAAGGTAGEQYLDILGPTGFGGNASSTATSAIPSSGLSASQTLFNGFQTANKTRHAESQVPPPARCCAPPSRPSCSRLRPPMWTYCVIAPSSRSSAAMSGRLRSRFGRRATGSSSGI